GERGKKGEGAADCESFHLNVLRLRMEWWRIVR
ncbi:MAG: hypothetical protein QOC72_1679, partial [Methylobacteriaceae bacterium]|nr:hypothetical protein [Methylobacteriaceae bacterium]